MTRSAAKTPLAPDHALASERLLQEWLAAAGSVLVGYSGGVDSAYLASVAVEVLSPARVLAVIGRSASYPDAQWDVARQVASERGFPLLEVGTQELADPRYTANPVNRCYYCKSELWQVLVPIARERGLAVVVDGTNADDAHDYRPGASAADEAGVRSPLREIGMTKAEIRERSHARGLRTWAQPASPCLSSRIPYHTPVTPERLGMIERAEAALRAAGVTGDLRVRYHGDLARVELAPDQLTTWLEPSQAARIGVAMRQAGFSRVAIDARGFRSGSLNVLHGVTGAGS